MTSKSGKNVKQIHGAGKRSPVRKYNGFIHSLQFGIDYFSEISGISYKTNKYIFQFIKIDSCPWHFTFWLQWCPDVTKECVQNVLKNPLLILRDLFHQKTEFSLDIRGVKNPEKNIYGRSNIVTFITLQYINWTFHQQGKQQF